MPPLNQASIQSPEDYLRLALEAETPDLRARFARMGLESDLVEDDTRFLLLRQVYLARVETHDYPEALQAAREMITVGTMKDVAHHDASRACSAMEDLAGAIAEQRLAARAAPVGRRSFHYWGLATLLHFVGDTDGAVAALERGERWAHADRPLLRAHRAWILLEAGEAVEALDETLRELESSPARKGYGEFVLGMLRHQMGDLAQATVHLRTFQRRNAVIDTAKAVTLREELRRVRAVLAEFDSD